MSNTPLVSIIMGSDSDLPTMQAAIAICQQFNVPHEVSIVSAHRTPDRMVEFAKHAHTRGIRVIIAGAGGAAHLPGMVASLTPLPVIGVPVATKQLNGVDSLYSIVQMPKGIPVATVAIGNAENAGLLAIQILATSHPELLDRIQIYRQELARTVLAKQEQLEAMGAIAYIKDKFPGSRQ
ncbi:5-(carboxyamino)imidazole ribonucleotide mutase [Pseudanabaena sp. PCC 6802]|uniref:5-(carboxyamino)imidazole ribonucleotide mutase n=1 Tax=Pseudanabaena sp. PCC 6802 TaxID=118173 RepID=UPI00034A3E2C|nr:5-(carboxyamino)imidazole ribonucleotide mutase [Pseudanabaena sp. PCC 6802]